MRGLSGLILEFLVLGRGREILSQAIRAQADEPERRSRRSRPAPVLERGSRRVRGRMLEQSMRLKQNLQGSRHVSGFVGLYHRKEPAFVFYRNRKTEIRTQRIIRPNTRVRERATPRNELLADLLVAEKELQPVARAKPVVRPSLRALSAAADPATDQVPVVCVTAAPGSVLIKRTRSLSVGVYSSGYICVNAFDSKIQSRNAGKVGEIEPGVPPIDIHISDR